jgi:predicted  nucleic acid-binding Zn-ribbon protein
MNPDLEKLLDLQAKDLTLLEVDQRLDGVLKEVQALDDAVRDAEASIGVAQRSVAESIRRRIEVEGRVETYRKLQEGRRKRVEVSRPGKETAGLMAELDLSRQVLAREESDWFRAQEAVQAQEARVVDAEALVEALKAEQVEPREALAARVKELEAERAVALVARDASAAAVAKPLRSRYERLRGSRAPLAVVALAGDACGACYTAVPMNRRAQMRMSGVVDACEGCGVMLYFVDAS